MHTNCFIIFAFIFCHWKLCILCYHEKENYQDKYTGIAIFEIISKQEMSLKRQTVSD